MDSRVASPSAVEAALDTPDEVIASWRWHFSTPHPPLVPPDDLRAAYEEATRGHLDRLGSGWPKMSEPNIQEQARIAGVLTDRDKDPIERITAAQQLDNELKRANGYVVDLVWLFMTEAHDASWYPHVHEDWLKLLGWFPFLRDSSMGGLWIADAPDHYSGLALDPPQALPREQWSSWFAMVDDGWRGAAASPYGYTCSHYAYATALTDPAWHAELRRHADAVGRVRPLCASAGQHAWLDRIVAAPEAWFEVARRLHRNFPGTAA